MSNRALVADPDHPVTMRPAEVADPSPSDAQVVIEVHHASLNHGDLNDAVSGRLEPGDVLGSDIAGIVVQAAADGSGPALGSRVVALAVGGFAQRVAVDSDSVAVVPDDLDLVLAAGLPVAGLAALRTLRAGGSSLGKRVLVTGASGGVGTFAVQLAAASGAHVIAAVGSPERGDGLKELGANEVVVGLDDLDPVDLVIESVGGPLMTQAWALLAPGGSLQSVGWTSGEPALLPPYATVGPVKSLSSYLTLGPAGKDLADLVGLAVAGRLTVRVGWRGDWGRIEEATKALRDRKVHGKAILDVADQLT
jgi:NADPH:quinone reductase-like Zn-dependent oxidoreductase